jgi:CRP-like cAMP-binding protein
MQKGELGGEMFFIEDGLVEVLDAQGQGVCLLSEGAYFGENALFQTVIRSIDVQAVSMGILIVLRRDGFERRDGVPAQHSSVPLHPRRAHLRAV